jgi:hypothetical protein
MPPEEPRFIQKQSAVATIRQGALKLGLPLQRPSGAETWGGHALRLGGVQYYGAAGVEVFRVQALARHSTSTILKYLEGAHHSTLGGVAAEAVVGRSLAQVRAELQSLQSERDRMSLLARPSRGATLIPLDLDQILDHDHADSSDAAIAAPLELPPMESHPFVTNTRASVRVHDRNPHRPHVTRCRWQFAGAPHAQVCRSPFGVEPAACHPRCGKCLKANQMDVVQL